MRAELREFLVNHTTGAEAPEFGDDESLLEAGVIDSMVMVDLIAHLEKSYGITVHEDDMIPENFDSIDAIVAFVTSRCSERPGTTE